jgi:hypothetical protein
VQSGCCPWRSRPGRRHCPGCRCCRRKARARNRSWRLPCKMEPQRVQTPPKTRRGTQPTFNPSCWCRGRQQKVQRSLHLEARSFYFDDRERIVNGLTDRWFFFLSMLSMNFKY